MEKKKLKIITVTVSIVVLVFILTITYSVQSPQFGDPTSPQLGDPMELPPTINSYPRPNPQNNVDRLLDKLEFGSIAFNAPSNININDSHQIQLLLSFAATVEELKQSIIKEGEKIGATIRVSDRMEARLTGHMFQIAAITPEIQAVSKSQETEWRWEIHPKEEGQHSLHLTLTALLEIDGHNTPRAIRTFERNIEITVTKTQRFKRFFKDNWQWLWAAILVPVCGWLWNRKKAADKAN